MMMNKYAALSISAACLAVAYILSPIAQAVPLAQETTGDEDAVEDAGDAKAGKPKWFGFEIGMNGTYSRGTGAASFSWGPSGSIFFTHEYIRFTAGFSRTQDYQLASGSGKYETVNFSTPTAGLSIYPHRTLELYGRFDYSAGDRSHYYRVFGGQAGLGVDVDPVSIGCSFSKSDTAYRFKSDDTYDLVRYWRNYSSRFPARPVLAALLAYNAYKKRDVVKSWDLSVSPSLGVRVHDTTGLEFGYDYEKTGMKYLVIGNQEKTNIYYSHTGTIGINSEPLDFFSFNAGASLGTDREDYLIAGCDLDVTFTILDSVSVSGSYFPRHYQPPPSRTYSRKYLKLREAWALYAMARWNRTNPYRRLSSIASPYWNHGASFSVSYRY